ncbi:hypothetical protein FRC19_007156 [Serendipita sp. 401]|nr:hypothetical protein FRC19_007156 [Serendipita sp. 401]
MAKELPIYLTLKCPFPDLSTFIVPLTRTELLVAEVRKDSDIQQAIIPLFKQQFFPNIQHLMYLRRVGGGEEFTRISLLDIYTQGEHEDTWSNPESLTKAADVFPFEAITGFDVNLGAIPSSDLSLVTNWADIAMSVMKTFRHLRCLRLDDSGAGTTGQDLTESYVTFSALQELYFKTIDSSNSAYSSLPPLWTSVTICAPVLEKMHVEGFFNGATNIFRRLNLKAYPSEYRLTLRQFIGSANLSSLEDYARYYRRVSILYLDFHDPIFSRTLTGRPHFFFPRLVKEGVHALAAQMPRLWSVRVRVGRYSIDVLPELLPLPEVNSSASNLSYHLEIYNGDLRGPFRHSLIGVDFDRLALDDESISWKKLSPIRQLYIDQIRNVEDLIPDLNGPFRHCLEEFATGATIGGMFKTLHWLGMPPFSMLTTLRTTVRLTLALLQFRIVPALKSLSLIRDSNGTSIFSDDAFKVLQEYREVTLETFQFPIFPSWTGLCRLINTRYGTSTNVIVDGVQRELPLSLKFPARPCPLVLHFIAAAFKGEYVYSPGSICDYHRLETGIPRYIHEYGIPEDDNSSDGMLEGAESDDETSGDSESGDETPGADELDDGMPWDDESTDGTYMDGMIPFSLTRESCSEYYIRLNIAK